jgi:3-oxoacyl-(acyl-carrier-protein) synthase
MSRRVVISGVGAICALGSDARTLWQGMREGRSAIAPLAGFENQDMRVKVAAQVRDFDPAAHFDSKKLILLDRVSQFALVAAREAVRQSGIDFTQGDLGQRSACVVGTGTGGEVTNDECSRRMYGEGNPRLHPLSIVRRMMSAPASQVSIEFGITGPSFAVSSACASANHAFAQAFALVRAGVADVALAGGTEACLTLGVLRAWEAMRVLADDTCRPFCKQRRGLVLGEGAGMVVLEDFDHARARGHERGCRRHRDAVRRRRGARDDRGPARCATRAGRHRLHQRPRHRDARQRPHRNPRDPRGARRTREASCRVIHQIRARPRARRRRRTGNRRRARRAARRRGTADRQFHRPRSRV